jgi:hypothetical protein
VNPESHYRDMLAKQVGGRTEVTLPFGRADVMTDTTVYEVEPIIRWRIGASQALRYSAQVVQQGALAVYGQPELLAKVYSGLQSLPWPGLELWWLDEDEFVLIESYEQAGLFAPNPNTDLAALREAVRSLALNQDLRGQALKLALLEIIGYTADEALDALGITETGNRSRTRTQKRRALARKGPLPASCGLIQDDILAAAVRTAASSAARAKRPRARLAEPSRPGVEDPGHASS